MDTFDIFTSIPSTTHENGLSEFENTHEITNNPHDDFSWLIENNPTTSFHSDNATSSQVPTASNTDLFENHEQVYTSPPIIEDIFSFNSANDQSNDQSSFNMFPNEKLSPLEVMNKKREEEIAVKDAEENRKIEELRQQAKKDLENWYNERQRQMDKKFQTMKNEDNDLYTKALEKSSKESCDWSKVIRLLNFTDGKQSTRSNRDLTRMKECMFNAKRINDKKILSHGI